MRRLPDPDADRAARARTGDTAAFEELVREHQRPLFGYIYRMCGNAADAEEVAQAAFVKAWQAIGGFRGESSFKTWLFRIATNLCINRRTRTRPTEELSEFLPAPEHQEPQETFRQRVREETVQTALAKLPPDQRSALVLSVYQGLSYKEIAASMGKSARAVDSLLFRAKTNLRRSLAAARARGVI